jgi:biotin carboxyl carrier protein
MRVVAVAQIVGVLADLCVDDGDLVARGDMVCQVESMKTMFAQYAPQAGRVHFLVELGELVGEGDAVFSVDTEVD